MSRARTPARVLHGPPMRGDDISGHDRVERDWGWHARLHVGEGFVVKRLVVQPGQSLSLQRHEHRAEHWVVLRGEADVLIDGLEKRLQVDGAAYVPVGAWHRLSNPGHEPLHVIEVQTGAYISEDDILRAPAPGAAA